MWFQWIGGPTFLLRVGRFTVLSDPMLGVGEAAFIMHGHPSTGADRVPIARLAPLPPLELATVDTVLLSHLHTDHFDPAAKATLSKDLPLIAPESHVAAVRESGFARVQGMNWWDETTLRKADESLHIVAVPARHSADDVVNADLGVVNGYDLRHQSPAGEQHIYWTSDTVWFDGLEEILAREGHPRLLVPHLGAVGVGGPWGRMTLDALEATRLVALFQPQTVIPIHHSTFTHYVEPISLFVDAIGRTPCASSLVLLPEGGIWEDASE